MGSGDSSVVHFNAQSGADGWGMWREICIDSLCPLAPTLFLFFVEAISSFLASREVGLHGLRLPIREEELLDAEFADDIAMYLHGQEANLRCFERALETFCDASGAHINWHKSCGFWIGQRDPPQWLPSAQFQWIPAGTSVRYLGCQIGIHLLAEQQIAPLLLSIRKKLLHWSSARLSLAGRVVVANQVLLATMWYVTSCWIFSSSCISQVQRLITNFLWSRGDGRLAKAKVAWPVITLPTSQGGLGIVDPVCQSKALLGKFIVRGLFPEWSLGRPCFFSGFSSILRSLGGLGSLRLDGYSLRCAEWAFLGSKRIVLLAAF